MARVKNRTNHRVLRTSGIKSILFFNFKILRKLPIDETDGGLVNVAEDENELNQP